MRLPCASELDFGGPVVFAEGEGDWTVGIEAAAIKADILVEGLQEEIAFID